MLHRSDGLPDHYRALPDLCPTSARPRASSHAGLPDLPNLSGFARIAATNSIHTFTTNYLKGWVGRVGREAPALALVSGCPTSAQPSQRSGSVWFHGNPSSSSAGDEAGSGPNLNANLSWQGRGSSPALPAAGNSGRAFGLFTDFHKGVPVYE